jgi:hypothetical protein
VRQAKKLLRGVKICFLWLASNGTITPFEAMENLISFNEVKKQIEDIQNKANENIKNVLSKCECDVCIRIMPTYLSHVDVKDGYPIQLNIWNDNIKDQPGFPVFGQGINPV